MDDKAVNIEEPAIGRDGILGDLYDAHTGQFLGGNIFSGALPQDAVSTVDRHSQKYSFDHKNSYSSALNNWHVEGELKLNILSGLVKIEGKGKYMNTTNTNSQLKRITLVSKLQTKREILQISRASLQSIICQPAFTEPRATHALTQILWGASVSVTFDEEANKSDKKKEITGSGAASVGEGIAKFVDPSASAEIKRMKEKVTNGSTIKIALEGDVAFGIPSTIDEAMQMIKTIPDKIKELNDGKGVQVGFIFTPLERIVKYFPGVHRSETFFQRVFHETNDDLIRRTEGTFDLLLYHTQRVNAFNDDFQNLKEYFSHNDVDLMMEDKVKPIFL